LTGLAFGIACIFDPPSTAMISFLEGDSASVGFSSTGCGLLSGV
jgi:hypothetical protein